MLKDLIWTEKYRPESIDEIILDEFTKAKIKKLLINPKEIPSLIFYSTSPGTGKTSLARIIVKELDCDFIEINASIDRGIDTIRNKAILFAQSLSSTTNKRCIIMEEADSITKQAFDSLRNLMETYSHNAFFIFTCNDISKIPAPIKSRCFEIVFGKPDSIKILERLKEIVDKEQLDFISQENLEYLIDYYYPDIRNMIKVLQESSLERTFKIFSSFEDFYNDIKTKEVNEIAKIVFSGDLDMIGFVRWFFKYIFDNYNLFGLDKCGKIAELLAEIEKNYNLGVNLEIIFLANIIKIKEIL